MATVIRGSDNFDTAVTGVLLSGEVRSEGSTGTGSAVDMASLSLNLTGFAGKRLIAQGSTGITETENTANASILRLHLNNGSSTIVISALRSGVPHGGDFGGNSVDPYTVDCVYIIPSSHATTCTLKLNGGLNAGTFRYGNQNNYSHFDGENAGVVLTYFVI
tara:strand:+ start:27 stop:512 length:486 start_codon:yes stop_codon:yes gene_type:complete